MTRKKRTLILSIAGCLLLAAGAFLWATGLMDSLDTYRSPLEQNPPQAGEPFGDPLTRRLVFVLVDGLREDTSLDRTVMPFLNELRSQGAWATMHSQPPSYSAPGYSVLFTGAWPSLSSGPALNREYEDLNTWTQDNLVSSLNRAGVSTALSAYNWFEKLAPQHDVSAGFYTSGEDQYADREVVDAALSWLDSGAYEFIFIHIDQVDYAGHHEGGPLDEGGKAAAARADALIEEITTKLDLEQDTIFICSDHGHIDAGGHGGQDAVALLEPFVLAGSGIVPGAYPDVQMVDVAPTLAALLGTGIPASSQGRVLAELLDLSSEQEQALQQAALEQQTSLAEAYFAAIGVSAAVEDNPDPVAAHQAAMETARANRLQKEQLPRFLLTAVFLIWLAIYIRLHQGKELEWILTGAFLYVLLFNLRYAIIDGLPYSLSWVTGVGDLIGYITGTALVALVIPWLVIGLIRDVFRRGPLRAAQWTLMLTLAVSGLLALPVLWSFVQNGVLISWTLPDFGSMYLGFVSLLQMLSVAAAGVVLAGIAATVAQILSKRLS